MRLRSLRAPLLVALVSVVGAVAACSDDDDNGTNPPNEVDLSGTYTLVSVTQGGITVGPEQGASGTLVLTQTTYSIDLTIPSPTGPVNTVDSGTYEISGDTWTQESDNAGGFQGVGTYSLSGGTLTVDVTTAGVQVLSVWQSTD
jgi:hypothetical protein